MAPMLALNYHPSIPRIVSTKLLGALRPRLYTGPLSPLRLEELPDPRPVRDDWVVIQTRLCGICGSDYKQIFLDGALDNPLTAVISFPHVLGHEIVGEIIEAGPRSDREVGERVAVNAWLSCGPRGIDPPCRACQDGQYQLCRNFQRGALPPSIHLGNCAGANGGFAQRVAVHTSQALRLPDAVGWDAAVLADPFSVALHSVWLCPPADSALVYGCGTLGLLTVAILHHRYPEVRVIAVARHPHQQRMAADFGAHLVLDSADTTAVISRTVEDQGGELFKPWRGLPWSLDGVSVVYDTVGLPETMEVSLRLVRARGSIVVVGVEPPRRFEWTPLYFKEVVVAGANAFSVETNPAQGARKHAMEHYFDFLAEGFDATRIITHRFALTEYRQAFVVCRDQARHGAIKAIFEP
jgi:threonine dehydrogenase-like Zn-dependent dehydrogenase